VAGRAGGSPWEGFRLVTQQVARLEELFRTWQDVFTPQPPSPVPFAVEQVVQRSADLLAYRLRKLGGRFVFQPEGPTYGYGRAQAVLHAVINLLVNAADAVEDAGRVQVRVLGGEVGPEGRGSGDGAGVAEGGLPRRVSA